MTTLLRAIAGEYALHFIHWWWQGTLVAALSLAVVRLAPGSSPRFRAAVLALALWKLFLPPMLPSPSGLFSRLGILGAGALVDPSGAWLVVIVALALVHGIGAAARLRRVLQHHRRLRPHRVSARRIGRVRIAVARPGDPLAVPVTFGWWRPVIVLPASLARSLSAAQRRIVFAHERRHIERFHGLLLVLEEVFGALGWIQPLFRLVVREHRRVREQLCDADAVERLGIVPVSYAEGLLEVAALCGRRGAPAAALAAVDSTSLLASRFAALGRRVRWSVREAVAAALLWALLLPGIHPRLPAAPTPVASARDAR